MKNNILKLAALSFLAPLLAGAQEPLIDVWYIAPGNSQAVDALPTATFKSPLFSAQTGGERVSVNELNGDLSAYHIIFDNTYTDNGPAMLSLWGGNSTSIPGSQNYTVGAITLQNYTKAGVSKFMTSSTGYGSETTLTVNGDFTFINNSNDQTFRVGESFKSIDIKGSLKIENSKVNLGSYTAAFTTKNSHIYGNVEMLGTKSVFYSSIGNATQIGTFENPDLKIDGIVNMHSADNKWLYSTSRDSRLYSYISVGGVDGTGKIISDAFSSADDRDDSRTVIAFTTKSGDTWDFKGNISSGQESQAPTFNKHLDIEMRGEAGGTQILRVSKDANAYMDSNIAVYSGTLLFSNMNDLRGNTDEQKYNQLVMEGGKFGATGQSTDDSVAGDAFFNDIVWNSGTVIVDVWNEYNFSIIYADTLTFGEADAFMFEFINETGSDLSDIILNVHDFMQITNGITEDQIAKMSGYSSDGQWQAIFNAQLGSVTFVQVPEPSEIAAIFGAMVLAFAAYRRRK